MSLFTGRPRHLAHPDWMPRATKSMESSISLYRRGLLPPTLEVPMVVVPCRYILRSVYGSDLRAAVALLGEALAGVVEKFRGILWRFWHYRVLMQSPDRMLNEMLEEKEDEDA